MIPDIKFSIGNKRMNPLGIAFLYAGISENKTKAVQTVFERN